MDMNAGACTRVHTQTHTQADSLVKLFPAGSALAKVFEKLELTEKERELKEKEDKKERELKEKERELKEKERKLVKDQRPEDIMYDIKKQLDRLTLMVWFAILLLLLRF